LNPEAFHKQIVVHTLLYCSWYLGILLRALVLCLKC
jgi:hypothetical protein